MKHEFDKNDIRQILDEAAAQAAIILEDMFSQKVSIFTGEISIESIQEPGGNIKLKDVSSGVRMNFRGSEIAGSSFLLFPAGQEDALFYAVSQEDMDLLSLENPDEEILNHIGNIFLTIITTAFLQKFKIEVDCEPFEVFIKLLPTEFNAFFEEVYPGEGNPPVLSDFHFLIGEKEIEAYVLTIFRSV